MEDSVTAAIKERKCVMYTLQVPVLSTIHLPGQEALDYLIHNLFSAVSEDEEAMFICMWGLDTYEPEDGDPEWLLPFREWVGKHKADWVRFDADREFADEVDDLPKYPDAWK